MEHPSKNHILHDLGIIGASILAAIWLQGSGLMGQFVGKTGGMFWLESIVAGMLFTSAFTTAPAMVLLGNLAQHSSPFVVAAFGGFGALIGDLIIFRFFRDTFAEDFFYLIGRRQRERILAIFRTKLFTWFTPFVGALIMASPLPDELAMVLMGFSKTNSRIVIVFSLISNTLGILVIALVAKALE